MNLRDESKLGTQHTFSLQPGGDRRPLICSRCAAKIPPGRDYPICPCCGGAIVVDRSGEGHR